MASKIFKDLLFLKCHLRAYLWYMDEYPEDVQEQLKNELREIKIEIEDSLQEIEV